MEATQTKSAETAAPSSQPVKEVPKFKAPKKKRKWVKRLIIILVAVALIVFLFSRCMGAGQQIISSAYLPYTAEVRDMTVSVSGTGTIEPLQAYKVTTLVSGEILEAPFEEGQTVQKGDVLFRIDARDLESNIEQLQLNVRSAQLALDDLLKTQSDNQKDRNVKAEDAGIITKLYVDQGDSVTVGTVVADVLDRDHMKLKVPFHSADAQSFYIGQTATVSVTGTAETISGTVDEIAATDEVGPGGTLVRQVTILVNNPGVLSDASQGSASVNGTACASGGTFAYASSGQITAKAAGDLDTLSVKEGDRVSEGQVIGVISEADLETQIENARISLENAQLSLQNAQEKLEDYTITSTITGEVIEKNLDVGDNISGMSSSGSTVTYPAVIYDRSQLTFDMAIDERDISKIQVGQKVEITADALDSQSFTGVVDKVNINGTTVNGNTSYPVTVKVNGAPEELYPGMNVSAKIIVEEAGSVLTLPVEAVERGDTVLVALPGCLDENGLIANLSATEQRQVTLGRNDDNYIEIVDGLEEGDVVVALSPQGSSIMSAMGME
ncbi:HlyD family efflux transporter periplasmic adaptor subunit [Pseudoflavonifractor phocaeensis]|uniref:HlyD family efflux transporter periplasmic adaptor subunit n=1 Tax=Pseudoflavonifractor phocaeensis TaxID=1870988 RepID=UPI00195A00FC|nr:HlyD family efflux transporter periplasmic adaptor subunit [Pseudoflavonifractor phocaeensis]MBM6884724.1 HlyD family efflux transporter periplasmic adaptor subunit [Pseudoflavonifractor phocaeensis]